LEDFFENKLEWPATLGVFRSLPGFVLGDTPAQIIGDTGV
jgi:hypothetical protein